MKSIIDFLFEHVPQGFQPQLGGANRDKRALYWLPGKKPLTNNQAWLAGALKRAVFRGCTQLAFPSYTRPMDEQTAYVCWAGLDIDWDDNEHLTTPDMALMIAARFPEASIRTSASGLGLHVLFRLAKPIKTTNRGAGRIIKALTAPVVTELKEKLDINVCKADKRMFWLTGGQNRMLKQTNRLWDVGPGGLSEDTEPMQPPTRVCLPSLDMMVQSWVSYFMDEGVLTGSIGPSNLIYVGDVVNALAKKQIHVQTRSKCSGNGQKNGYLDIRSDKISLWTYADGHVVWSESTLADVDAFFGSKD